MTATARCTCLEPNGLPCYASEHLGATGAGELLPGASTSSRLGVGPVAPRRSRAEQDLETLRRIAAYADPRKLKRDAEAEYGLSYEEALEMAYENVLAEARRAVRGRRRPTGVPRG